MNNKKNDPIVLRSINTKPKKNWKGQWKKDRLYPLYSVVRNNGTVFMSLTGKMKDEPYVIYDPENETFSANEGWEIVEMSADSRQTAIGGTGTQGEPGKDGEDGKDAGFGTITASADSNTGTPSVEVSTSGPNTAKNISFAFHGLKGERGLQGAPGVANADIKVVTTLPTASAETAGRIFLVETATAGTYARWYTEVDGSTYTWRQLGTTDVALEDYATKDNLSQLQQKADRLDVELGIENPALIAPTRDGSKGNTGNSYAVVWLDIPCAGYNEIRFRINKPFSASNKIYVFCYDLPDGTFRDDVTGDIAKGFYQSTQDEFLTLSTRGMSEISIQAYETEVQSSYPSTFNPLRKSDFATGQGLDYYFPESIGLRKEIDVTKRTVDLKNIQFNVTAGSEHSSSLDKIYLDIKAGEKYLIGISPDSTSEFDSIYLFVAYYGESSTNAGRLYRGKFVEFTATKDIDWIGFYLGGSAIKKSGNIIVFSMLSSGLSGQTKEILPLIQKTRELEDDLTGLEIATNGIIGIRNGSCGNESNPNEVTTSVAPINGAKYVSLHIARPNTSGCHYYFGWMLTSSVSDIGRIARTDQLSGYITHIDATVGQRSEIIYVGEYPAAVGIAVCFGEADENGNIISLRATDFGENDITLIGSDSLENLIKLMVGSPLVVQTRLRNGSGGNASNLNFVSTEIAPTNGAKAVSVYTNRPCTSGYYYVYCWSITSSKNDIGKLLQNYQMEGYIAHTDISDVSNPALDLTPYPNAVGVCFTIGEYDGNGNYHALRIGDFSGYTFGIIANPSLDALIGVKSNTSTNAFSRNEDRDSMLAAAVRMNKKSTGWKDFMTLLITDSHDDSIAESNSITMANGFQYIQALIHLGDMCGNDATNFSQARYDSFIACEKPFYFVAGNHDVGNSKEISKCITTAEYYTRYIVPLINAGLLSAGEYTENEGYYYHDFADKKIRLVCVYEYDGPDDIENGEYTYRHGDSIISKGQAQWFCGVLNSTPSDYGIIIAMHNPFSPLADCVTTAKFNDPAWVGGFGAQRLFSTDIWADIVNAWVNKSSNYHCSMVCTGDASYLNVNGEYYSFDYDFSSRNDTAKFICFIGGHVHRDCVWKHRNYGYQYQITPICANTVNYAQCPSADIRRTPTDGPSKDSLTAIGYDYDNQAIRLVKLGVNVTEKMTPRDYELIAITD